MPRISVVMPVFNGARFLDEAIDSVLASTFTDFELLVLDDGSTDSSLAIARHHATLDQRIRCIALPHGGIASVRNAALRESRGELIANLDSDDVAFPLRFEKQVRYLDRHPECVAVGSRALVVDAAGKPRGLMTRNFTHQAIDGWHMSGLGGGIGNSTAMFRKAPVIALGGYHNSRESIGEDYDLWLRLAECGRLANLRDVLIRYRVHDSNLSTDQAGKAYREEVTLQILARAFARRGISDRAPARIPPAPLSQWEKLCDESLLLYFRGDRRGALLRALRASVHNPAAPTAWYALRTIVGGAPPAPAPRAA